MFGLGFSELFFIVLMFVVFIKPENVPETLRKIAFFLGKVKGAINDARAMMEDVKDMGNPQTWVPPHTYEGPKSTDVSPVQKILAEIKDETEVEKSSTTNGETTDHESNNEDRNRDDSDGEKPAEHLNEKSAETTTKK